jgi:hypothetical protein
MKIYVHYDEAPGPAHTEVMSFDGASDVTFELLRVLFVDAYNAKQAPARLEGPHALSVVTDEIGAASHPLAGSIFDCLNDGDDVFFASGSPGQPGASSAAAAAAAAPSAPLADQIEELKQEIKRATDDGEYDRLAPLAQQIKQLEARQKQAAAVPAPAPAVVAEPANPIEASKASAGDHSHYYWDRQAKGAAAPRPQKVVAPPAAASKIERIRTLSKFSLSDEGSWVRLYIPHDGVGELPKGCVTCEYRERSFDLRIDEGGAPPPVGEEGEPAPRHCYRLHAPVLAECVVPSKCKLRVKPKQVVISLRKLNEGHPWQELHKIKGIGETGTIAPDYGETTTLSSS